MTTDEPVSRIMTTQTTTADVSQRPSEVRRLLTSGRIHHLPVLRGDRLVGMVSSSDVYRLSLASFGADEQVVDSFLDHQFTVEDIMKRDLVTIHPSDPIREAVRLLAAGRFHALPVIDDSGRLEGIVTSTDLIRYLLAQL